MWHIYDSATCVERSTRKDVQEHGDKKIELRSIESGLMKFFFEIPITAFIGVREYLVATTQHTISVSLSIT
ncbi:hypothetical protein THF1C08_30281 [Vibrio jasicida]|uniref:Uncharacterized protein n=1 Tax=Vibrio jasicida TaxID=766224 RepID=A0AAU9QTD3_9VIBR|nr:hypothetical protein THF1C08_30281 [Vibrio jasicida]CAH1599464.1 hypothetical protein THF1A12_40153 [Vibrio jasicida]